MAAFGGIMLLMLVISLTGNYNFFTLVTAALAVMLLDDSWWPRRIRTALRLPDESRQRWQRRHLPVYACAAFLVFFSLVAADISLGRRVREYRPRSPEWAAEFHARHLTPWNSIHAYGLFQDMTTERNEVVIEVSTDGVEWKEVPFPWKPNSLTSRPGQCAPHQPRLDWQMWFAALHPGFQVGRDTHPNSPNYWFGHFLAALLEGRGEVWRLVGDPPVDPTRIAHIRALFYRYRFTSPEEKRATGAWWKRELLGRYSEVFSKSDGAPP
jgi:hypothetical protein